MEVIDLKDSLSQITEQWSPKIIAELNGQEVKLVKLEGEFIWHSHELEDEMFLVLDGAFDMHFRDRVVRVKKGQSIVVPKGVDHKPVAATETHILLFEPASTINTGNVYSDRTRKATKLSGE